MQEIAPDDDKNDGEETNVLVGSFARDVKWGESETVVVV